VPGLHKWEKNPRSVILLVREYLLFLGNQSISYKRKLNEKRVSREPQVSYLHQDRSGHTHQKGAEFSGYTYYKGLFSILGSFSDPTLSKRSLA
jgi:hypothetical protein